MLPYILIVVGAAIGWMIGGLLGLLVGAVIAYVPFFVVGIASYMRQGRQRENSSEASDGPDLNATPWIKLLQDSFQLGREEKYHESIKAAEEALKINPQSGEAWRLIGNAYEMLGDEEQDKGNTRLAEEYHHKAAEAWRCAKEVNPNIVIPFFHE